MIFTYRTIHVIIIFIKDDDHAFTTFLYLLFLRSSPVIEFHYIESSSFECKKTNQSTFTSEPNVQLLY